MKRLTLLAATALLLASTPSVAASEQFEFDKAHTQIIFAVNHLGFSNSHGKFLDFDGGFTLDEDKPEKSSVNVTIKTASIDMDDQKWDDHLKNEDFFNVEKFPDMTFKSTKVELTGDKTAKVTGDLTLLGVTKPVTLDVTLNKTGVHPYSKKYVAGFSATGTLNRSEFGMTYGLPGVGDEVKLIIEVEGTGKSEKAPEKTEEVKAPEVKNENAKDEDVKEEPAKTEEAKPEEPKAEEEKTDEKP
jgi:polyisoprenoid-binding protein YceI